MKQQDVTLLVVDDDDVDLMSITRGFRKAHVANRIVTATSGERALSMLRGEAEGPAVSSPLIVLLDLNMPRMNGIEFLAELRADQRLTRTVVFVLTTSDADRDKCAAYEQHVAGYCLKSRVGDDFGELVRMLDGYSRVVELPEEP